MLTPRIRRSDAVVTACSYADDNSSCSDPVNLACNAARHHYECTKNSPTGDRTREKPHPTLEPSHCSARTPNPRARTRKPFAGRVRTQFWFYSARSRKDRKRLQLTLFWALAGVRFGLILGLSKGGSIAREGSTPVWPYSRPWQGGRFGLILGLSKAGSRNDTGLALFWALARGGPEMTPVWPYSGP